MKKIFMQLCALVPLVFLPTVPLNANTHRDQLPAQQQPDPSAGPDAPTPDDVDEIAHLLDSFVAAAQSGDSVDPYLSPLLVGPERTAALQNVRKDYVDFEVAAYDLKHDLKFEDPDKARLQVYVRWKSRNQSFEQSATVHFRKVVGKWYFRDLGFLEWSWSLPILGGLSGLVFAIVCLGIWALWRRRHSVTRA